MRGSKSNAHAQNGKHILVVALQPKGPLLIIFNMAATGSQGIRSESEASSLDELKVVWTLVQRKASKSHRLAILSILKAQILEEKRNEESSGMRKITIKDKKWE